MHVASTENNLRDQFGITAYASSPRSRGALREVAGEEVLLARSTRSAIYFSQVLFDDPRDANLAPIPASGRPDQGF